MIDYQEFLSKKKTYSPDVGITVDASQTNPSLRPWQSDSVRYLLRRGRGAVFWECGLGKTFSQLEWAYQVVKATHGRAILLCPLAVAPQTLREYERFNIGRGEVPIKVCDSQEAFPYLSGICVTNYEKLSKFDAKSFNAVILDESSILKSFNGKTKQALCDAFAATPFRLACTATPAPNDQLELGNHAEFLGAMKSNEMISRWFINDSMQVGKYRLRHHAKADFWDWVSSWAVSLESPADLGYPADDYNLPPLEMIEHCVEVDDTPPPGFLFSSESINATSIHREKRKSNEARSELVASLVNASSESWIVWCDTDYEADELRKRIPDAVEVRGSHPEHRKVRDIDAFTRGEARVIISKSTICGFGLNWQHCQNVAFVGVSYSFEQFYQAVRRVWRFGQTKPVRIHVALSPAEEVVWRVVRRKQEDHMSMKASMSGAMLDAQMERVRGTKRLDRYVPNQQIVLPNWMNRNADS